ncbi:unnamed protein product [Notodromas monacha]|uniref:Uncharacterized protein n=1 Tax=Notodromas monacha TaxID=399045 RepID=A0A7R9BNH3_9CRUS|nr:unnamed protein product [Notodromas monacha]CAG0918765.1 unnamed protein product [Notodromas monacha]
MSVFRTLGTLRRRHVYNLFCQVRFYPFKGRKYPVDPAHEDTLPGHCMLQEFQYVADGAKGSVRLYGWGNTVYGALGEPLFLERERKSPNAKAIEIVDHPARLVFGEHNQVKDIACGYGFTLFLAKNKEGTFVYGTGLNSDSQIGHQHPTGYSGALEYILSPMKIHLPLSKPKTTKILGISAGRAHTLIATDAEGVYSLGHNGYGQCGRPIVSDEDYFNSGYIHKMVPASENVEAVFCGQDTSFLLKSSGEVLSCGWAADGQTGRSGLANQPDIQLVEGEIKGRKIVKISCAGDCVLALDDQGLMFGWGNSEYSQFSVATDDQQLNTPTYLEVGRKVKDVASAGSACLMLDSEGSVWSWGYGFLGDGSGMPTMRPIPEKIPDPLFGKNTYRPDVKSVAVVAGLHHFGVLTNAGDLYSWGLNRRGCLGTGVKDRDQYFPMRVSVPFPVKKAVMGVDHTMVICKDFL